METLNRYIDGEKKTRSDDGFAEVGEGQSSLFTQAHEQSSRGWLCLDGSVAGPHASGIDMRVRARWHRCSSPL